MSKKLVLPRFYMRNNNVDVDIEDDLSMDEPILFPEVIEEHVVEEKQSSKKRQPTQYNLFIKEQMAILATTRPELVGKERFKYAVYLWNEKKKVGANSAT
jgi:hypothetical protein